jgi:hypothetical protein
MPLGIDTILSYVDIEKGINYKRYITQEKA